MRKSIFAIVGLFLMTCQLKGQSATATTETKGPDIVDIAVSNENFTTLVAAVKAAGLVGALKADAELTVFAPVNGAFGKLAEGTVETLLKPENKKQLQKVLQYHVVVGKFSSADLKKGLKDNEGTYTLETLAGGNLRISLENGKLQITDDNERTIDFAAFDIEASNGVIHVVDTVCLPK